MIKESVIKIIAKHLEISPEDINENDRLVEDCGADSLDTLELVMIIEDEFGILIPDEEGEQIRTVADMINTVERLKS